MRIIILLCLIVSTHVAAKKPLTVEDIMKFRQIEQTQIAENGEWLALTAEPDRGDSQGLVYSTTGNAQYSVELGIKPQISKTGNFVLFKQDIPIIDKENKKAKELKKHIPNWVLVNTQNGEKTQFDGYKKAQLSPKGQWLGLLKAYKKPDNKEKDKEQKPEDKKDKKKNKFTLKDKQIGANLSIQSLSSDKETTIENVLNFEFSPTGNYLAAYLATEKGKSNQVILLSLIESKTNDFKTKRFCK